MPPRLLDTASIVASAEIASGTSGLVDAGLYERVDALAGWFRAQPGTTATQAEATRRQIVRILARRLSIAHDIVRHPEILDEVVADPVFIIGFARTGTTLLQSLLGADPANRTPRAWQVREPSPPPGEQPVQRNRLARATADVAAFVDRCPGLLALHPYWDAGAQTEIEDEEIFTLDFLNAYPSLLYEASTLAMMVSIGDGDAACGFLKRFMQHQQWRCPRRRWVMKGVEHQRQLPALFAAFPDAKCIWPHREPGDFLPSNLAIAAVVYDGITAGGLDRHTLAESFLDGFRAEVTRVLRDPSIDDPRILHVLFTELTGDPLALVRKAYLHWGFELADSASETMRIWLAEPGNRGDRYGRHTYDFAPFGIDWSVESQHYQAYRERFLPARNAA